MIGRELCAFPRRLYTHGWTCHISIQTVGSFLSHDADNPKLAIVTFFLTIERISVLDWAG